MAGKRQDQLCGIRIGTDDYILPMADGLKLVDIMSRAIPARRIWEDRKKYAVIRYSNLNSVDLSLVRPDEIELPDDSPVTPAKLKALAAPKGGAA